MAALVDWSSGLCTHALQEAFFREGKPSSFVCWQVGDKGPAEKEQGFSDQEFWTAFGGSCISWVEAVARGDVDTMWALLEAALCSCHGLRSPGFQAPAARNVTKQEEPKRDLHEGDLCEASLTAAILRKRRWQQLLAWSLKPDSE